MPPRPRNLREHVYASNRNGGVSTFLPHRHEALMSRDSSTESMEFDEDDRAAVPWCELLEIVFYYRYAAKGDKQRREAALAFRDLIEGRRDRYNDLMAPDGKELCWTNKSGSWELVPYVPPKPSKAEKEKIRAFVIELWEGFIDLAKRKTSKARYIGFVRELARKHDVDEQAAFAYVARELRKTDEEVEQEARRGKRGSRRRAGAH